jgi:hypothetical protein
MNRAQSQSGQMTIEMVLVIIILLSTGLTLAKAARNQGWMKSLVSGPWKPLKSMIEDGVWSPNNSKSMHPHHRDRHGSYEADEVTGGTSGGDNE